MDILDIDRENLERHPLSALFGDVDKDAFDRMVKDVEAHGFTNDMIVLQDGQVLDGWHRYQCASALGLVDELDYGELDDRAIEITPAAYVLSQNVHRRHLTAQQRVDLVVKAHGLEYAKPGRPEKPGNLAALTPRPADNHDQRNSRPSARLGAYRPQLQGQRTAGA